MHLENNEFHFSKDDRSALPAIVNPTWPDRQAAELLEVVEGRIEDVIGMDGSLMPEGSARREMLATRQRALFALETMRRQLQTHLIGEIAQLIIKEKD